MIETLSESKANGILNDMKTVKNGMVALKNTEDFIGENGTRPVRVHLKYPKNKEVFETNIDWELYNAMEGGVFHAYLQLYLDGFRELGNESMREAGHKQEVNHERLLEIDTKYNL